jgi:putative flippase GtrA
MICVFACLYALARYFGYRAVFDRRDFLRTALRFIAAGAIGGMLSAAFIIPTYLGGLTQKTKLHADASVNPPVPILSVLIRFFGGTVDTGAKSPNLAAGTLVLLLVPVFFSIKGIRKAERIAFGAVLAFLLAATEIKPLYVLMHGGQMPNAFPFRFAFLITALLVILAFRAWLGADSIRQVHAVLASGVVWLVVLYIGRQSYPRILSGQVTRFDTLVLVLGTAVLAAALWLRVRDRERPLPRAVPGRLASPAGVALAAAAMIALDATGSAFLVGQKELGVSGTSLSWAQWYSRPSTSYRTALEAFTPKNDEFFRTEGFDQNLRSTNDGLRDGNFAQTHFSSLSSGTLHQVEADLGFAHHDAYVWSSHTGATLLTDGLFGFKYLVTTTRMNPTASIGRLGVTLVRTYDDTDPGGTPDITKVWRIDDTVPVGFRLSGSDLAGFTAAVPQQDPYAAQEQVFNAPGAFQPLCAAPQVTGDGLTSTTNADGSLTITSGASVTQGTITWSCTASGAREAYLYAPQGLGNDNTYVRVDGQGRPAADASAKTPAADPTNVHYPYGFSNGFQDLGGVQSGSFTVTMKSATVPAHKTMTIMPNAVRGLDPVATDAILGRLAAAGVTDVHWSSRGLTAKSAGDQAGTVFFSVPSIPGWAAKVDGKSVTTTKLLGTFLGVPVGPGEHSIALEFTPPGLYAGIAGTLLGIILLFGVWLMQRMRREPEFAERVQRFGESTVVKYLFVGGLAFVTDLGTLWLGASVLGLPVWVATALAYAAAWVVNFGLNRVLTFADHGARDGKVHKQSIRFTILVLINLVITELLMTVLIHFGVNYLLAKVASSVVITLYNFEVYKRWVFAGDKSPADGEPGPQEEPDPADILVP